MLKHPARTRFQPGAVAALASSTLYFLSERCQRSLLVFWEEISQAPAGILPL